MSSAIGIRHSVIQQKSRGFMCSSFNTREYFHGVKPHVLRSIKWIFMIMVFLMPVILLSQGLSSSAFIVFALAFIVQYLGLLAERWFFFAQANHPQNLYYQTI